MRAVEPGADPSSPAAIKDALRRSVATVLTRSHEIDLDRSFAELGGTSLAAVHVLAVLERDHGVQVDLLELLDVTSLSELATSPLSTVLPPPAPEP